MKRLAVAMLFVSLSALPVESFAQVQRKAPTAQKTPEPTYQKVQRMEFDNDQVEGRMARPDEMLVSGTRHDRLGSLIRLRGTFHDALLRSVESL